MKSLHNEAGLDGKQADIEAWMPIDLAEQASGKDGLGSRSMNRQPQPTSKILDAFPQKMDEALLAPIGSEDNSGDPLGLVQDKQPVPNGQQGVSKADSVSKRVEQWIPADLSQDYQETGAIKSPDWSVMRRKLEQELHEKAERMAQERAKDLLGQARQQSDEIVRQAKVAAEKITIQARQDGLLAGKKEVAGLLSTASQIVEEVKNWRERTLAQSETMVLDLIHDITIKLFGNGFELDAEVLGRCFERSLAEAKSLGALRVRAHPDDVAALGSLWASQQTSLTGQSIELVPNRDIQRGGCHIEGDFGSVDARVDTQLGLILDTFQAVHAERIQPSTPFAPYKQEASEAAR
jgi:flagellar biosynthesis/type III secretory pathway protein FliH